MIVREIRRNDAKDFLRLRKRLDAETSFMLLEPGERTASVAETRAGISRTLRQENSIVLVLEEQELLVGYLQAIGGRYRRNRHSAYIVVGILQAYTHRGLGTRLFQALEAWAREAGLHRLELTVMTNNEPGVHLYRKMGFVAEGVKRDSLFVDGEYVDEYYMAKLLS
jgi:RimJ/RimL family protein N-acetyltransferase